MNFQRVQVADKRVINPTRTYFSNFDGRTQACRLAVLHVMTAVLAVCLIGSHSIAQDAAPAKEAGPAKQAGAEQGGAKPVLMTALKLLPDTAAGVVRIPNLTVLCDSWKKTTLSGITDDPSMKPLIDANFGSQGAVWEKLGDKVGLRPKELYEIATGEVIAVWLPFENDNRRPSSVCVVADIRGKHAEAEAVLKRVDQDLKADGATRTDVTHAGETVRVYRPKTRPGQLKIEQVVVCLTKDRVIASDRDSVVLEILDAIANDGREDSLDKAPLLRTVWKQALSRSEIEVEGSQVEWFVKPLTMGRIIRDVAKVDRGNKVRILNLLENQGFDALQAAGGIAVVGQGKFDLLHRGYVHAPPVTDKPSRYRLAARMLQFPNTPLEGIPAWVPANTASITRVNWKIEEAFWAVETLVDEAFDNEIFRPSIEGIRDDEEGPQIDIEKNVLPNLSEHLLLLTDNTLPATVDSERVLVAIEVLNADAIGTAVRKAMEVEPDVFKVDTVPGVEIWQVKHGSGDDELDDEFFDDLGFEEEIDEEQTPLLNTWAIAMVPAGKGSKKSHLVFSSHVEWLVDVAKRMQTGEGDKLADLDEVKDLLKLTSEMGADEVAFQRVVRLRQSLRAKYELQRQGELKNSDSVLASLVRRMFEGDEPKADEPIERLNVSKWPAFSEVEKYFRNAFGFVETTETGWNLNGFLLK